MEKFYFKSYGVEVGSASNLKELKSEIDRLSKEDKLCIEYHLKEGQLRSWLLFIGEEDAANKISGARTVDELIRSLGIKPAPDKPTIQGGTRLQKKKTGTLKKSNSGKK